MGAIGLLIGKDLRLFFRDRGAVLLTFLLPVVVTGIFGAALGNTFGGGGNRGELRVRVGVAVDGDRESPMSKRFIKALGESKNVLLRTGVNNEAGTEVAYTPETLRTAARDGHFSAGVIVKGTADPTEWMREAGRPIIVADPNSTAARAANGMIYGAFMQTIAGTLRSGEMFEAVNADRPDTPVGAQIEPSRRGGRRHRSGDRSHDRLFAGSPARPRPACSSASRSARIRTGLPPAVFRPRPRQARWLESLPRPPPFPNHRPPPSSMRRRTSRKSSWRAYGFGRGRSCRSTRSRRRCGK
jgi:ABC-2 type transport system permease protein